MYRVLMVLFLSVVLSLTSFAVYAQDKKNSSAEPTTQQVGYSESTPYSARTLPSKKQKEKKVPQIKDQPETRPLSKTVLPIPVSVFRKDGALVGDLQLQDFKAYIDGVETEVVSIERNEAPINIVLLFDMSPSTQFQIKSIKEIGGRMVEKLQPEDKLAVARFDADFKVQTDLTNDRALIAKGIKSLDFGDGTSIYNAISELFEKTLANISGRTAVIVFTDGVDTTSRKADYESSLLAVERTNISVFPIYFDTYADMLKITSQKGVAPTLQGVLSGHVILGSSLGSFKKEADHGRDYLSDLFRLSGGRPVSWSQLAKGSMTMFDIIPTEIRSRYYLTVKMPDSQKPGVRRQVKVRVNRPNLIVFAKGSYLEP